MTDAPDLPDWGDPSLEKRMAEAADELAQHDAGIMDSAACATMAAGYCPLCGHAGFRLGPRGGGALNVECMGCRERFTVAHMGWRVLMLTQHGDDVNVKRARRAYFSAAFPEKRCVRDNCGAKFRGPAIYCCYECAVGDAR